MPEVGAGRFLEILLGQMEGRDLDAGQLPYQEGNGRLLFNLLIDSNDPRPSTANQVPGSHRLLHRLDEAIDLGNVFRVDEQNRQVSLGGTELRGDLTTQVLGS